MKNCYLCIISTFCGNDTQTFYNCLRRGFRRGASCICISIKKKAISERYTIKTASRLLQNDIACPADRGGSPTMRTNPGNKMTKRTSRQRTTFFFFFPKHWFISLVATVITRVKKTARAKRAQEIFYPESETPLYKCGVRSYLRAGK